MVTLAVVSLFSPHAPAVCAERLAAVIGPPGPTIAATVAMESTKQAFGTVTESGTTLVAEQAGLLGRRNTPSVLRAAFSAQNGGTLIVGSVEPPDWLGAFFVVFVLVAGVILAMTVAEALRATPADWHQVQLACLFPVFGVAVLWFGKQIMTAEAQRLVDVLRQALDAVPFETQAQTAANDAVA